MNYQEMKVVFSDNVEAVLSVKLINGDGENPAQVYGNIDGRFGVGSKFSMFDKKQNQHIDVKPGEYIPLSYSEVRVPEKANEMEIEAYLMDYDVISADDEIANGKVVFLVKSAGETQTNPIDGKYGRIEVTVVWA